MKRWMIAGESELNEAENRRNPNVRRKMRQEA
jgi:hypothetical protein